MPHGGEVQEADASTRATPATAESTRATDVHAAEDLEVAELREMLGRGSPWDNVRGHVRSKGAMPLGSFMKLEVAYWNQQTAAGTRQMKEEARLALKEHQQAERERQAYWKASVGTQHVEARARVEELRAENAREIARQKAGWATQRKEQQQRVLDDKRQLTLVSKGFEARLGGTSKVRCW